MQRARPTGDLIRGDVSDDSCQIVFGIPTQFPCQLSQHLRKIGT